MQNMPCPQAAHSLQERNRLETDMGVFQNEVHGPPVVLAKMQILRLHPTPTWSEPFWPRAQDSEFN